MPTIRQRVLSISATLAALLGAGAIAVELPGGVTVAEEVRWRLARDPMPPGQAHAVTRLILLSFASDRDRAAVFQQLLLDADPTVTRHALVLLGDRLATAARVHGTPDRHEIAAFRAWWNQAALAERIAAGSPAIRCAQVVLDGAGPAFPATDDDWRWLIASTRVSDEQPRQWIDGLLFASFDPAGPVDGTLRYIDGLFHPPDPDAFLARLAPADPAAALATVRVPLPLLRDALTSDLLAVRWCAVRILAVAGDPAGLPALTRPVPWLDPRGVVRLDRVLARIFGEDWEDLAAGRQGGAP
jgi:hypothetical protein